MPQRVGRVTPRLNHVTLGNTISFRLDELSWTVLQNRAAHLGVSVHELARHYVLQILHESDERRVWVEALTALRNQVRELREDVALATEVLLADAGQVSESDAQTWVNDNFRKPCSPSPTP